MSGMDDDLPVFTWTCEVGGHEEESFEPNEPPDPEVWEVIDEERRFGNCNSHVQDGDGDYYEDDEETPIQLVDVDGKPYGPVGPARVDVRAEERRQAQEDEEQRRAEAGDDPYD